MRPYTLHWLKTAENFCTCPIIYKHTSIVNFLYSYFFPYTLYLSVLFTYFYFFKHVQYYTV